MGPKRGGKKSYFRRKRRDFVTLSGDTWIPGASLPEAKQSGQYANFYFNLALEVKTRWIYKVRFAANLSLLKNVFSTESYFKKSY
jgi:hypothetical protein